MSGTVPSTWLELSMVPGHLLMLLHQVDAKSIDHGDIEAVRLEWLAIVAANAKWGSKQWCGL